MSDVANRFWSKVEKTDGCWVWRATKQSFGYGHFWMDGRMRCAHRVAYEMLVGPIGLGLTIDHLCRRRDCVNPAHMETVTLAENIRRSDNPTAVNARKRKCPRGHAYRVIKSGKRKGERYCPTCQAARKAEAA